MAENRRERERIKRAKFKAAGLTSKGKPRKPRFKPKPEHSPTMVPSSSPKGQVPQRPRTPMNVLRRPVNLPPVKPLTQKDREAA